MHGISSTTQWAVGTIIVILIQMCVVFYWAVTLEGKVNQHTTQITRLEGRLDSVDSDIRAILVGIEQVKARLGIIEVEK